MKLLEVDLESPLPDIGPANRGQHWVLVRLHGDPMAVLRLEHRAYSPGELGDLIVDQCSERILMHLAADGLRRPEGGRDDNAALFEAAGECPRPPARPAAPVTVAVCTRNRPGQLSTCLDSLLALDYPTDRLQLLVVDNAPADAATERVVRERSPRFSYVQEPRPGLNWARNRAILEADGVIVAFTDDDVSVDSRWVRAIAAVFEREPDAMAVTGLVLPHELDEPAQVLFEEYGGFGRGFMRRYFQTDPRFESSAAAIHGGAGKFGTGANMAFRRSLFDRIGLFDPALDVGTLTNGGGDLEMFFRVLKAGHMLVYEPAALVRHRHRREYGALRTQLANNGTGLYAYLVRSAQAFPDERSAFVRLGVWWFWHWSIRRLLRSFVRPGEFPRDLVLAELYGSLAGLTKYSRAARRAADIVREHGPQGRSHRATPPPHDPGARQEMPARPGEADPVTACPDKQTIEQPNDGTTGRPDDRLREVRP